MTTAEQWRRRDAEPFEPGNTKALVHGANSERSLEAKAAEVRAHLVELAPWCDKPAFAPALARFLRAEARELLLHEHIERVVASEGAGAVSAKVWEQVTAAANSAAKLSGLLGLDPSSYARLRATVGQADVSQATYAELISGGQEIADRRAGERPQPVETTATVVDGKGSTAVHGPENDDA